MSLHITNEKNKKVSESFHFSDCAVYGRRARKPSATGRKHLAASAPPHAARAASMRERHASSAAVVFSALTFVVPAHITATAALTATAARIRPHLAFAPIASGSVVASSPARVAEAVQALISPLAKSAGRK